MIPIRDSNDDMLFETIYLNYYSLIKKVCRDYGFSSDDSCDMAQDIMIKIYNQKNVLGNITNVSSWVSKVSKNYCVDVIRKKRIALRTLTEVDDDLVLDLIQDEEFDWSSSLTAALKNLSKQDYYFVMLRYFKSKSIKEIAKLYGMTESNVKMRLLRSRKQIFELLINTEN